MLPLRLAVAETDAASGREHFSVAVTELVAAVDASRGVSVLMPIVPLVAATAAAVPASFHVVTTEPESVVLAALLVCRLTLFFRAPLALEVAAGAAVSPIVGLMSPDVLEVAAVAATKLTSLVGVPDTVAVAGTVPSSRQVAFRSPDSVDEAALVPQTAS